MNVYATASGLCDPAEQAGREETFSDWFFLKSGEELEGFSGPVTLSNT